MPFYIYMTVNNINGHKYIGKRKCKCDIKEDAYLGSGRAIVNAIKKYGRDNFSKVILEECDSYEECDKREKYWIEKFDAVNNKDFYNIASGGEGGNTYSGLSIEELTRIKEIKRLQSLGENNPNFGKQHSDDVRKKISSTLKKLYVDKTKCSRYGKFGEDNPCSKRIKCIELNTEFIGIREAARVMNIPSPNITRALKDSERFSAGKNGKQRLHWIYCDENEC